MSNESTPLNCPGCGDPVGAFRGGRGWRLNCPGCYDPVIDSGDLSHMCGHGDTKEEAMADWNAKVHEYQAEHTPEEEVPDTAPLVKWLDIDAGHIVQECLKAEVKTPLTGMQHFARMRIALDAEFRAALTEVLADASVRLHAELTKRRAKIE